MDPVTHAALGMTISKITGNGINASDPASMGIIIGSVFPDIDILLQKWGDYVYLKNHRCASHSFIGLVVSAAFISAVLSLVYPGSSFFNTFLWSLLGCLSHSLVDTFNSYGAKLLWPICKKKFSLSLLIIFDPVFIVALTCYIFTKGSIQYVFLAIFAIYLVLRAWTRKRIERELKRKFGSSFLKISILPSMTGLFRWHFVLQGEDCNIVGEKNVLKNSITVVKKLYKLQDEELDKILFSPVGEFFSEFTPLFHIACEKAEGITRYVFIDLRYYIRNNFLHHAVLEIDDNQGVTRETFNPYSINRINLLSVR